MIDPALADALRLPPPNRRVMTQTWVNLAFIHYPVEPELVQRTLPIGLTVDTFPDSDGREMAWIGFVPFEISRIAFARKFKVPSASRFLETNVRTYVHRNGKNPGVWFYSLDAESWLACQSARAWYGLPYWHAEMSYREEGDLRSYGGVRLGQPKPSYQVQLRLGESLEAPCPGSLEFFLVERYLLYSFMRGRLYTGRVHHSPYILKGATLISMEESLTSSAGLELTQSTSILFSPGVSVDVFPLEPISRE